VTEDACDPTPRHGFQSACTVPQKSGCSVAGDPHADWDAGVAASFVAFFGFAGVRRRRAAALKAS
jgi:hypothetical protein